MTGKRHALLTFCLASILLTTNPRASAQTAEETAQWLQVKLDATQTLRDVHVPIHVSEKIIDWKFNDELSTFYFVAMLSVHFKPAPAGQASDCAVNGCDVAALFFTYKVGSKTTDIRHCLLPVPGASDADGARLVKALQHIAVLNGAKIVDDNLF